MDVVRRILIEEIESINRDERRDNRIRFSRKFMVTHPWLFGAMLVSYVPVAVILLYSPYFGLPYLIGFTLFLATMVLALSMDISPRYRFEDIDKLDLRVCYNGEWYNNRHVSPQALETILHHPQIDATVKTGIYQILQTKGDVYFYDIFSLAYRKPSAV
ncbi:hypothetical protein CWC46_10675 [Prodigiosinella confusarubida]|uniref:Inner membrane protein YlaC n=1 Tax=Serratia sp. (strain ATCC 39006) TaxID=104623 RepID=A0A2I5TIY9_SERS3|nr:YlaC family protein [Serratia sp. ATCC 39006]AUH00227.1 hypothetical protein CWC46_10675 [Serratia sp. ATCC 39006]AUH04547.1 hypothetical protein Ser39006_010680 [Serratia sp. ATCC 39006]